MTAEEQVPLHTSLKFVGLWKRLAKRLWRRAVWWRSVARALEAARERDLARRDVSTAQRALVDDRIDAEVVTLRKALATERKCRLANEKELHRADALLGDARRTIAFRGTAIGNLQHSLAAQRWAYGTQRKELEDCQAALDKAHAEVLARADYRAVVDQRDAAQAECNRLEDDLRGVTQQRDEAQAELHSLREDVRALVEKGRDR